MAMLPLASYTGVILRLAMATTEKIVMRQARMVHLRLSRTRKYSPSVDS
jgi:hypothetical protein